jgi:hypothetical protein
LRAPDSGRPQLQVTIVGGDSIGGPNVQLNIRSSRAGSGAMDSPLVVFIEGMGQVDFKKAPVRRRLGPEVLIDASFDLPPCLQRPGKSHRLWVRFEDAKESRHLTYVGTDSGVEDCGQKRVWGIAVGISKYDRENSSLQYADQDAQRFFDFWNSHGFYKVDRFALLTVPKTGTGRTLVTTDGSTDEQPLASAKNEVVRKFIEDEIKEIKKGATLGDIVVIYLAGHGFSLKNSDADHWFFMPSDGNATDPKSTAIGIPRLVTWLDNSDFNVNIPIVVFLDACRDLRIYPDLIMRPINQRARLDFTELLDKYEATLFVATGSGASAYELPEKDLLNPKQPPDCVPSDSDAKGGGAFTHVLLEALNGKDLRDPQGQLPLNELEIRLEGGVKRICAKQQARRFSLETSFPGFFFRN